MLLLMVNTDMIIDSHVHIGKALKWDMTEKEVLLSMQKYNIDFSVISNIEANEFDFDLTPLPSKLQKSQIEVNKRTLTFVKENYNKVRGLFWIKPYFEGYSKEIEAFIKENTKYFCGVKIHPYHSKLKFTVDNFQDYLEMCRRLDLPVVVHTAADENSDPKYVYETAKIYKDLNFILVHMGLGSDNKQSIKYIKELPNLYGDTTWVSLPSILTAIRECGSEKIMFGTDSPIDGLDTYEKYTYTIKKLNENLSEENFNNVFCNNVCKLFKLNNFN